MKIYLASAGKHTSSNGFVNYLGSMSADDVKKLHAQILKEIGPCVIVDGSDNLGGLEYKRPVGFVRQFSLATGIQAVAHYHSGVSGITESGVILSWDDYPALCKWYEETYGVGIDANNRIHFLH